MVHRQGILGLKSLLPRLGNAFHYETQDRVGPLHLPQLPYLEPSSSNILQSHIHGLCDPCRVKRCSDITKGRIRSPKHVRMLGGRITLIPKRQGSTGRPLPALSWPRTSSCDTSPGRRWLLQKRERWHLRKTRYSHGPCPFLHVPRSSQLQASLPINEATVFSPAQISGSVSSPGHPQFPQTS